MIIDVTGVELIPGDLGKNCPANGENPLVECACDECDYLLCCIGEVSCDVCTDRDCPKSTYHREKKPDSPL